MTDWKPEEIVVNERVKHDPVTTHILEQCEGVPVRHVQNGKAETIVRASETLKDKKRLLDKILAGKKVLYISPASNDVVDLFTMPDDRIVCPHFNRLKLASNG